MRGTRHRRAGTAALEFGIIAPAFLAAVLGLFELGWQLTCTMALEYGARQGARYGAAGATPSGHTRAAEIERIVVASGSILSRAEAAGGTITVTARSYPSFGMVGGMGGTPGYGGPGEIVQYTVTLLLPAMTPFGDLLLRQVPSHVAGTPARLRHRAIVVLRNEPFPTAR